MSPVHQARTSTTASKTWSGGAGTVNSIVVSRSDMVVSSVDVVPVERVGTGRLPNWSLRQRPVRGDFGVCTSSDHHDGGGACRSSCWTGPRAGDADAFAALVDPHRTELQVHCYRMLGSLQDAEYARQETLLAAWVGLAGFEGRSSVRTWLYRIATHRCLNALRSASRRPIRVEAGAPAEPSGMGEVLWL